MLYFSNTCEGKDQEVETDAEGAFSTQEEEEIGQPRDKEQTRNQRKEQEICWS